MVNIMTEQEKLLQEIDLTIAFTAATMTAVGITIYVLLGQRDMVAHPQTTRFTEQKLLKIGILASVIFLISIIYFEISAFEQYQNEPSQTNAQFLAANSLSFIAQSIRVNTLLQLSPNSQEEITTDEIIP